MHKDAQTYFAALETADADYKAARTEIGKKYLVPIFADHYSDEYRETRRKANEELTKAENAKYTARDAAKAALKESKNKVIAWAATSDRASHYWDHVEDVLRELPDTDTPTRDEVEAIGDRHGWCGVWTEIVDEAEDEGAFGDTPVTGTKERELLVYVRETVTPNLYTRQGKRLRELLMAALAEAKATPVPEPATADTAAE